MRLLTRKALHSVLPFQATNLRHKLTLLNTTHFGERKISLGNQRENSFNCTSDIPSERVCRWGLWETNRRITSCPCWRKNMPSKLSLPFSLSLCVAMIQNSSKFSQILHNLRHQLREWISYAEPGVATFRLFFGMCMVCSINTEPWEPSVFVQHCKWRGISALWN